MVEKFINPNWHVIAIHYPIGLLTTGLIFELISLGCPRDKFRAAGRWMITIGGLAAAIALVLGIYAFRDVVASNLPASPDFKWGAILQHSQWTDAQWKFIKYHLLLNSIATAIFLAVVAVGIGSSDEGRRKAHVPLLIALIVGVILTGIGAWFGGEMVYRLGTAVLPHYPAAAGITSEQTEPITGIPWYIPPLQLHVCMAGLVIALAVAALALTFRKWNTMILLPPPPGGRVVPTPLTTEPVRPGVEGSAREPERVCPGTFWVLTLLAALLTALAGIWSALDEFTGAALRENIKMLQQSDHHRLLLHVISGVTLIVLALLLAIFVRFAHQQYGLIKVLIVLILIAAAIQVWMGVMMLFDSHEGSLIRLTRGAEAQSQPVEHEHTSAVQKQRVPSMQDLMRASQNKPAPAATRPTTTQPTTAPAGKH